MTARASASVAARSARVTRTTLATCGTHSAKPSRAPIRASSIRAPGEAAAIWRPGQVAPGLECDLPLRQTTPMAERPPAGAPPRGGPPVSRLPPRRTRSPPGHRIMRAEQRAQAPAIRPGMSRPRRARPISETRQGRNPQLAPASIIRSAMLRTCVPGCAAMQQYNQRRYAIARRAQRARPCRPAPQAWSLRQPAQGCAHLAAGRGQRPRRHYCANSRRWPTRSPARSCIDHGARGARQERWRCFARARCYSPPAARPCPDGTCVVAGVRYSRWRVEHHVPVGFAPRAAGPPHPVHEGARGCLAEHASHGACKPPRRSGSARR